MKKYRYRHEFFENFENQTLTEHFLNKFGEQGWKLKEFIMLGYGQKGEIKGICIFMRREE